MRLLIQHRSQYRYERPAALGPHVVRLRPCAHARARVEGYGLTVSPECELRWQQDPAGNHVARVSFRAGTLAPALELLVELTVDIKPVNPFDFYLDDDARESPFSYAPALREMLAPFLLQEHERALPGTRLADFIASLPSSGGTVPLVVELNALVNQRTRYVLRDEPGVWTPEETLAHERGSCRDSATLLVSALRHRGFAARFVSGYLVQLTDEGMIPDAPGGAGRDVVDLHAWAEVYLPGAGWVGLDATSGLLCGEGHIPLACAATHQLAAPLDGTASEPASGVSFEVTVGRLGHEPRPTRPYEDAVWEQILTAGERADALLEDQGLTLTMGGEPTFNAREHTEAPEWNGEALGPTKWSLGQRFAAELKTRLTPGGITLHRQGKHYPGESLPRWNLDLIGRDDGAPVWSSERFPTEATPESAERFARALAKRLGLEAALAPAYEDPWRFLQEEASLPVDVDPLKADLSDSEERRRLARVLDRGLATPAGWVLPVARVDGAFIGAPWRLRRGHLFLLVGDSPIGLRLPLRSLGEGDPAPTPVEEDYPPDPRVTDEDEPSQAKLSPPKRRADPTGQGVRTALCVEARGGELFVFLPPAASNDDWFALVREVDAARVDSQLDVTLEGYGPPSGACLTRAVVSPDPGVLELNLPVTRDTRGYASLVDQVFDAALHAGLHSEKYLLDGRMAGSGGGNHLTLGGPTPLQSPFLKRPDVLASMLTFWQHHPSLSFLFTGLFVGPTSQAPRLDEARHDALHEMEIALARAFATRDEATPPPWLVDQLFRHLLVDVSGNTHRAEVCIDKLFDPYTPHGRQGLIELRAFEMPPHPRMVVAQMVLARALVAAFAVEPYRGPLARWGATLHDRFLLPHYLWSDLEDVLAFARSRGVELPAEGYRPFLELRCPKVGELHLDEVSLSLRNALEPWSVLGEELTRSGTARFVDSSMERVELTVDGLVPERHAVIVNGRALPLRPTAVAGRYVGGVRFRAWAPPHALQPHLGIHHPLRFEVVDQWSRRSLGACAYHVWHPEGRAFDTAPLTRFEAEARRAQRFTAEGPSPWPVRVDPAEPLAEAPYTLDLRRFAMDRPMPRPEPEEHS